MRGAREQGLLLSYPQAASCLGVGRGAVVALVSAGKLSRRRVGRRWYVTRSSLEAWVGAAAEPVEAGTGASYRELANRALGLKSTEA